MPPTDRRRPESRNRRRPESPGSAELSAHLWDLRSQAEAKLRCLTKLQLTLAEYSACAGTQTRELKRARILEDLKDIVTISVSLRSVAEQAFAAAESLS
jgi:hypothetical protein